MCLYSVYVLFIIYLYFIYILFILCLYSFYQKTKHSRHCHPLQRHWNGNHYNKNYAVPNSKKLWGFRNKLYQYKYINPIWLAQFLLSWYQSGGNTNETMHSWIKDTFKWMKKQMMGLNRVPGYQQIKKISYNFMKAGKWLENVGKISPIKNYSHEINDKIYYLLSKFISLDLLREQLLDCFDGCGLLYFPNAEKIRSRLFNNFDYKSSIKKTSWMKSEDYDKLIELVIKYEKECDENKRNDIGNNIWKDLLSNDVLLNHWVKTMKHRVTRMQIENFINGYWRDDVSDDEFDGYNSTDDDDDDIDVMLDGTDKKSPDDDDDNKQFSCKEKYK